MHWDVWTHVHVGMKLQTAPNTVKSHKVGLKKDRLYADLITASSNVGMKLMLRK